MATPHRGDLSVPPGNGDPPLSEHGDDGFSTSDSENEREVPTFTAPLAAPPALAVPQSPQGVRPAGWTSSAKSLFASPLKLFGKIAQSFASPVTDAQTSKFTFSQPSNLSPLTSTPAPGSRRRKGKGKHTSEKRLTKPQPAGQTSKMPVPSRIDPEIDYSSVLSEVELIEYQRQSAIEWQKTHKVQHREAKEQEVHEQGDLPHKPASNSFKSPEYPAEDDSPDALAYDEAEFQEQVIDGLLHVGELGPNSKLTASPKFAEAVDFFQFPTTPSNNIFGTSYIEDLENSPFPNYKTPLYAATPRDVEMTEAPLSMRDPSFQIPEMDNRANLHYQSSELALTGVADPKRVQEKWAGIQWDEDAALDLFGALYTRALMFVCQNCARRGGQRLSDPSYHLKLTNRWLLLECGRPDKFWMGRDFAVREDQSLKRKYLLMKLRTITELDNADIAAALNANLVPGGTFAQNPYNERLENPELTHLHETCPPPPVLHKLRRGFAEIPEKLALIAEHTAHLEPPSRSNVSFSKPKINLRGLVGPDWARKNDQNAKEEAKRKRVDDFMSSFEGKCEHCETDPIRAPSTPAGDGLNGSGTAMPATPAEGSPADSSTPTRRPRFLSIIESSEHLLRTDVEFEEKIDFRSMKVRIGKIV